MTPAAPVYDGAIHVRVLFYYRGIENLGVGYLMSMLRYHGHEIDLIFAVREAAPRSARDVNPAVPQELATILEKSMARSRSARYQSALEFRNALLTFLRSYDPGYRRNKLAQFLKRIFADGDYVIVHVHAVREPGTRGNAIIDIFRLEDGKVVEHWDVIQPIPEKSANDNGMF